ncbi:MAG: hypothetical protein JWL77_2718 [Chthonomonadaceae bacterium]|nr:hypothetical protein [Chthonomonadaceae bacterium]
MEMPRTLMPWATWLELFPREILQSFGPMLQRLDRAVGPLRVKSETGSGEPDGFDGLTRRGSYERLLLTEWLLADELPDEFLRRAVMGEHAFYQVARREPAGSRLSVALFDAGPNQLGSPRLAHLAALIVLARRAEAAGAEFRWGVLQSREMPLLTAAADSIRQLLDARSLREADAGDLAHWQERLGSGGRSDDFWLIGGTRLEHLLPDRRVSRLFVTDPLATEARELDAAIHSPGKPTVAITLPLPEEKFCGRLLRDPFGVARAAPRKVAGRFAPTSNFVWGQNGTKLIARCASNALVVYPIPNSPAAGAGRPKIYASKYEMSLILAAGRVHKAIVAIQLNSEGQLYLESIGGQTGSLPVGVYPALPEDLQKSLRDGPEYPLVPCFSGPSDDNGWISLYTVFENGLLIDLHGKNRESPQTRIMDKQVQALAPVEENNTLVSAKRDGNMWRLEGFASKRHSEKLDRPCRPESNRAFFGCGGSLDHPDLGLSALQIDDRQWLVVMDEDDVHLEVDATQEVVGVIGPRHYGNSPGLVVLEADRRSVRIIGKEWTFDLPRANADIVHASASHADPYIAYVTEAGEVVIYSLTHEADLYRLEAGAH